MATAMTADDETDTSEAHQVQAIADIETWRARRRFGSDNDASRWDAINLFLRNSSIFVGFPGVFEGNHKVLEGKLKGKGSEVCHQSQQRPGGGAETGEVARLRRQALRAGSEASGDPGVPGPLVSLRALTSALEA